MLRGLPASIIFHGAVILGGSIAWPYIAPEREIEILVPVTIDMQLDTVTNLAPIVRQLPEPEPEEPEAEEVPVEESEEAEADAEEVEIAEDDEDTTDVRDLPQQQAMEEEVAETAEEAEEKEQPEEPKEEEKQAEAETRDPDPLADVLGDADKLFSEVKQRKRAPVIKQEKKILENESQVREPRRGIGDRSKETARIEALIYSQMIECWDGVRDQPNYERLQVTVSFKLTKDGRLDGNVSLINPKRVPIGDTPMRVATERALRAARKCAPYRIPKDAQYSHNEWKDVILDIGH